MFIPHHLCSSCSLHGWCSHQSGTVDELMCLTENITSQNRLKVTLWQFLRAAFVSPWIRLWLNREKQKETNYCCWATKSSLWFMDHWGGIKAYSRTWYKLFRQMSKWIRISLDGKTACDRFVVLFTWNHDMHSPFLCLCVLFYFSYKYPLNVS